MTLPEKLEMLARLELRRAKGALRRAIDEGGDVDGAVDRVLTARRAHLSALRVLRTERGRDSERSA